MRKELSLAILLSVAFTVNAAEQGRGEGQIQPIDPRLHPSNSTDRVFLALKKIDGTAQKKKKRKRVTSGKNTHRSRSGKHKSSVAQENSTPGAQTGKPDQTEMKRTGEFKGDLRDLPQTTPEVRERPKREDPKIKRKVIKKPGTQKDN